MSTIAERALERMSPPPEKAGARCPLTGNPCGDPRRQRSTAAHNHFFAIIEEAFKRWPETADFQPEDKEHLRAYLLIKARHFEKMDIRCKNSDASSLERQLDGLIRWFCEGRPPLMHAYPWGIRVFKPRSISYAAADRKVFQAVSETVFEIIETTIGVKIEDLKREAKLAA